MLRARIKFALLLSSCIITTSNLESPNDLFADEIKLPPKITVETSNGRFVTGRVSAESNEKQLTLVLATPQIVLRTHIAWKQIARAKVAGKTLELEQLRKQWKQLRLPKRLAVEDAGPAKRQTIRDPHAGVSKLVASIRADAWLGNWDRDAEPDGLELAIELLDKNGRPATAGGSYTARLFGLPQQFTGGQSTLKRTPKVVELAKWGDRVRSTEFADGVLKVRLPFRQFDPNKQLDISADTLLEVEFGIAGRGVFKTSIADVLVRQPSFFRDELQQRTGRRQLSSER
jgi:hypothetical protein